MRFDQPEDHILFQALIRIKELERELEGPDNWDARTAMKTEQLAKSAAERPPSPDEPDSSPAVRAAQRPEPKTR